jgi:uncharacterized membrane protein
VQTLRRRALVRALIVAVGWVLLFVAGYAGYRATVSEAGGVWSALLALLLAAFAFALFYTAYRGGE